MFLSAHSLHVFWLVETTSNWEPYLCSLVFKCVGIVYRSYIDVTLGEIHSSCNIISILKFRPQTKVFDKKVSVHFLTYINTNNFFF
jgi:hypothetical protein